MEVLLFALMVVRVLIELISMVRASILVSINNPYLRYRNLISENKKEDTNNGTAG